jgi:hypothetical protein
MAVNKIFLDTDGLTVGNGQLVTSGNSVSIANALLVGGNLYAPTLGISGNSSITGVLTVAGRIIASNTQASSNTTTGAIVANGGMGIAGNTNIGGSLAINGNTNIGGALSIAGIVTGNVIITGATSLTGNSSAVGLSLLNASESVNVSATAATGTVTFRVSDQAVLYYTLNATANWTPNVSFSSGTTLNTAMTNGQSISVAFLVTQGATAYFSNTISIDGSAVTPRWQGGITPTAGNASGIDSYVYNIIKTDTSTFTVLASLTQFK